jgi:serine/threonine protein kinase/TPR repeat protein
MKICPQCDNGYPDRAAACPVHGGPLTEIRNLRPGMLVAGTYRIVRRLGAGSVGTVYLAAHLRKDQSVVLKFLTSELSRDEAFFARFKRAAQTLSKVRHRSIVPAGALERAEDDTLFFPMDYVDGPNLREVLSVAPGPFDVSMSLSIIRSIAEGLGAAHGVGMIHLDIRPDNILVAGQGDNLTPRIANFGLAVSREDGKTAPPEGRAVLAPTYAAPELWRGTGFDELDGRTDFYALGVVLFEMLTRQAPFDATDARAWARQHLAVAPWAPSDLRPDLDDWHGLDELVLSLLAKDRKDRPSDAAQVVELLDSVKHGARVVQIPVGLFFEKTKQDAPAATTTRIDLPTVAALPFSLGDSFTGWDDEQELALASQLKSVIVPADLPEAIDILPHETTEPPQVLATTGESAIIEEEPAEDAVPRNLETPAKIPALREFWRRVPPVPPQILTIAEVPAIVEDTPIEAAALPSLDSPAFPSTVYKVDLEEKPDPAQVLAVSEEPAIVEVEPIEALAPPSLDSPGYPPTLPEIEPEEAPEPVEVLAISPAPAIVEAEPIEAPAPPSFPAPVYPPTLPEFVPEGAQEPAVVLASTASIPPSIQQEPIRVIPPPIPAAPARADWAAAFDLPKLPEPPQFQVSTAPLPPIGAQPIRAVPDQDFVSAAYKDWANTTQPSKAPEPPRFITSTAPIPAAAVRPDDAPIPQTQVLAAHKDRASSSRSPKPLEPSTIVARTLKAPDSEIKIVPPVDPLSFVISPEKGKTIRLDPRDTSELSSIYRGTYAGRGAEEEPGSIDIQSFLRRPEPVNGADGKSEDTAARSSYFDRTYAGKDSQPGFRPVTDVGGWLRDSAFATDSARTSASIPDLPSLYGRFSQEKETQQEPEEILDPPGEIIPPLAPKSLEEELREFAQAAEEIPVEEEYQEEYQDAPKAPRSSSPLQSLFGGHARESDVEEQEEAYEEESDEDEPHHKPTRWIWFVAASVLLLGVGMFTLFHIGFDDPKKPITDLAQTCDGGNATACSQLAIWYEHTNTVTDGEQKAATYYSKACDGELPEACRKLGLKYLFGTGVERDNSRAIALFTRSCDEGDYEGCDTVADIFHEGKGVNPDNRRAAALYAKACTDGDEFGCKWARQLEAFALPGKPPARHY